MPDAIAVLHLLDQHHVLDHPFAALTANSGYSSEAIATKLVAATVNDKVPSTGSVSERTVIDADAEGVSRVSVSVFGSYHIIALLDAGRRRRVPFVFDVSFSHVQP